MLSLIFDWQVVNYPVGRQRLADLCVSGGERSVSGDACHLAGCVFVNVR